MTKTAVKFFMCASFGSLVAMFETLFGTIDKSFTFLCLCILLDFLTGLACGAYEKKLSSDMCTRGLLKKSMVFVYVILANHLDSLLGVNYIRIAICYMYATGEVLSIIENGDRLGLPIPEPIKKAMNLLNGGEDNENE